MKSALIALPALANASAAIYFHALVTKAPQFTDSGPLSNVPRVPDFDETGGHNGTMTVWVGIQDQMGAKYFEAMGLKKEDFEKASTSYFQSLQVLAARSSWPFLVSFHSVKDMFDAMATHVKQSAGKLAHLSMPDLSDGTGASYQMNVTKLGGTRWLAVSELEMSCHTDLEPVSCHRYVPGDYFGVACVQYTDPTTNHVVTQRVGQTCHTIGHDHHMCHLAANFVVPQEVAAQVSCPISSVIV